MPPGDGEITPRTARLILLSICIGQTIVGLDQRAITEARAPTPIWNLSMFRSRLLSTASQACF